VLAGAAATVQQDKALAAYLGVYAAERRTGDVEGP
jgi:hypothetical protein